MNGKKILVVEDHKDSCLWIAAVLRQMGFTTSEAGDGAMAMRCVRSETPDLILLDLHLPAGGGEFVLESLRRQEEYEKIPVVIMTGDPDVDREKMQELGAIEIFRKPMDVHAFLRTIRRALDMETEADVLERIAAERADAISPNVESDLVAVAN